MTVTHNHAKQQLDAGKLALGFGVRQARTVDVAKIAKTCGYDWLFVDLEHNSMDLDTAAQICVAALDAGITPLVRVSGHEHFHAAPDTRQPVRWASSCPMSTPSKRPARRSIM